MKHDITQGNELFYIISFYDKLGRVRTKWTTEVFPKNAAVAEALSYYLEPLYEKALNFLPLEDVDKRYTTYYKKKRNGGLRRIDIPDDELKVFMREVNDVLINKTNFIFPAACCAYVKKRSVKTLAYRHRGDNIVFGFDIKDFFNNCSLEFILESMSKILPFGLVDAKKLETIISVCTVNIGGIRCLPQGAPTSPILSNIAMIPVDLKFSKKYLYSRYSDNIYISVKKTQNFHFPTSSVGGILGDFNPLFKLNEKKNKKWNIKKYGGAWICGLMLNREGNVTIGHEQKQKLKATIFSFLADAKNEKYPTKKELQHMLGTIAYYRHIEPDYVEMIIRKYEKKLGINYTMEVENILAS